MNHGCGFDAPGNLAHYLCESTDMHAWIMPGKGLTLEVWIVMKKLKVYLVHCSV